MLEVRTLTSISRPSWRESRVVGYCLWWRTSVDEKLKNRSNCACEKLIKRFHEIFQSLSVSLTRMMMSDIQLLGVIIHSFACRPISYFTSHSYVGAAWMRRKRKLFRGNENIFAGNVITRLSPSWNLIFARAAGELCQQTETERCERRCEDIVSNFCAPIVAPWCKAAYSSCAKCAFNGDKSNTDDVINCFNAEN